MLVAVALTAVLLTAGVALLSSGSIMGRANPVQGARAASDAQVQQMIAELRDAMYVTYLS